MKPNLDSIPVAVLAATRTPIGRFGGCFSNVSAPQLASHAIRACLERVRVTIDEIDEVILGNVLQAGLGPNPARRAAVLAGLQYSTPAYTINKVCGSGMKAVEIAANTIRCGKASIIVAGGMESMSSSPHLFPDLRWGQRIGAGRIEDSILKDALWDCFYDCHMGSTVEHLATEYSISRESQDAFALKSQQRYAAALAAGAWISEIAKVQIQQEASALINNIDVDENPRPSVTIESLASLRSAFVDGGTVSAGNSSSLNDGASVMILASQAECEKRDLCPLAWIGGSAVIGLDPMRMGLGPAFAIKQLLKTANCSLDDCDLLEINEAFSAQVLAVCAELEFEDYDRLNVNGGAIAIGHPIGASGARILVTLLHELARRRGHRGIAATCIGGGMGIAMEVISR